MYIFKNAIISIVRNKGRNMLIGIIILVISCATAVTLAINNSGASLIEAYKSKYEVEATLGVNRQNMMKDFNFQEKDKSRENMRDLFSNINNISTDDIENYANSVYVKNYYYTMSVGVNSNNLEKAEMSSNNGNMPGMRGNGGEKFTNATSGDFTLKGYSSLDTMGEFITGNYKITDGTTFDNFDGNTCLINNELATLNNIKVGDTITLIDTNNEKNTYKLTVSGIYEENNTESDNMMSMFTNSVNTIITNTNVVKKMTDTNKDLIATTTPTFILTDSKVIEKFSAELSEKGLDENLTVQTNLEQVEASTSTISNVLTFSRTFLVITLIIGTVVLLVINMINIRERKYEIGVLRIIGMKKSKVCLQFVSELFIVSFIAILLGAGLGATMSVPLSNNLLKNEISASVNEVNNIRENFGKGGPDNMRFDNNKGFRGVASVQAFDSIDAVVDFKVLVELMIIGLCITLISSISAITSIQKFSPLTILKERS